MGLSHSLRAEAQRALLRLEVPLEAVFMRWVIELEALKALAEHLDDAALVREFALRGWRAAAAPALRLEGGVLHGGELIRVVRQSDLAHVLATYGIVKPYSRRSTRHYEEFAKGALRAYLVLAEDYMIKKERKRARRGLERQVEQITEWTESEDDAPEREVLALDALVFSASPLVAAVNQQVAAVVRASSLKNYANLAGLARCYNRAAGLRRRCVSAQARFTWRK